MTSVTVADEVVRTDVASNRRQEIRRYLDLFGYSPDETMLEVYLPARAGSSHGSRRALPRDGSKTLAFLGLTHDPVLGFDLVHSRSSYRDDETGYLGFLFRASDRGRRAPHELLPLDFTPSELRYPREWRELYPPLGMHVAMEVTREFASQVRAVHSRIRALRDEQDVRRRWAFLHHLESFVRPMTLRSR